MAFMRMKSVAAGLVVAVLLSPACNPFKQKEPKAEAAHSSEKLQKALLANPGKDTSGQDILNIAPTPKK